MEPITRSIYGQSLFDRLGGGIRFDVPAHESLLPVLTHSGEYPLELALNSLDAYSEEIWHFLQDHSPVSLSPPQTSPAASIDVVGCNLGRLRFHPAGQELMAAEDSHQQHVIAHLVLDSPAIRKLEERVQRRLHSESLKLQEMRQLLLAHQDRDELRAIVTSVLDHVQHVEAVCFFVGPRLFAHVERLKNLVDTLDGPGLLPKLLDRRLEDWADDDVLVVSTLHALFLSGRSVRFEHFNGCSLVPSRVRKLLCSLLSRYGSTPDEMELSGGFDLFTLAKQVRERSESCHLAGHLRYRWIYALNFQKVERVMPLAHQDRAPDNCAEEFAELYQSVAGVAPTAFSGTELFLESLTVECLRRDAAGDALAMAGTGAQSWIDFLVESIVTSAVRATRSDYAMSSSIRDLSLLNHRDAAAQAANVGMLTPAHFYTCFVGNGLRAKFGDEQACGIAASVQRRMIFNRWHFIPGNLHRYEIDQRRHWYYPPMVPDLAVHSDVHRAAHAKALVKYSIRSPGPDAARPALLIGGRPYRGFYDIRVVRTSGEPYSELDMLTARRRTLWLEAVYAALVRHLEHDTQPWRPVKGFQVGSFRDEPA